MKKTIFIVFLTIASHYVRADNAPKVKTEPIQLKECHVRIDCGGEQINGYGTGNSFPEACRQAAVLAAISCILSNL